MKGKEVWFKRRSAFLSVSFWPCHWKGWILLLAGAWGSGAIAFAGIFWLSEEYFFFVWLLLAVIMGTFFFIAYRHSERVS